MTKHESALAKDPAPRWALERVEIARAKYLCAVPNMRNVDVWLKSPQCWPHYHAWAAHIAQADAEPAKGEPVAVAEADVEAAARAHCDFFGGQGWWDAGLIADTRPKAMEAMRAALSAIPTEAAIRADQTRKIVEWLRRGTDTYSHEKYARCTEMQSYWLAAAHEIEKGEFLK